MKILAIRGCNLASLAGELQIDPTHAPARERRRDVRLRGSGMKILAIRGCNLASLAGELQIDPRRAPFADTGVFAIVGNTGAGKSTLLDALCVALFDRTPRLSNHSRVTVGRSADDPATLGAHDARTLLRRGATCHREALA